MKIQLAHIALTLATFGFWTSHLDRQAEADEPERDGPWLIERPEGKYVRTVEMTLHPAVEPKPALKYRLLPDKFDLIEGNSAIYYLKAMGFLEQSAASARIREVQDKARKLANEKGVLDSDLPPYSWQDMPPQQLPLAEVKEFLSYTAFQPPLLAEATLRSDFKLDRDIRNVESPIAYLLPEIQTTRELARVQSLRCRVAVAEHRMEDAVSILMEQFTLAHHLGSDEFVISNLVGAAVLGIAMQDALYVLQEPNAPNLYWAFAALPTSMIDMEKALSIERQFMFLQLKALKEVDEKVRPAGYWQDFIDRILPQIRSLDLYDARWLGTDPQVERVALVTAIGSAYPGAKRYLIDECQMDRAKVDEYPTAQVVFLAMKRFQERTADGFFKWMNVPYHQAIENPEYQQLDKVLTTKSRQFGWASKPTNEMLAAVSSIRTVQVRVQQQLATLQTIEAIRMYGAANAGKLPTSLGELPYPVPNDPMTGKPLRYEVTGDQAMLSGEPLPYMQSRYKLRFAK